MEIIKINGPSTVVVEDEAGNRSHVFRQNDGKWRCLRCERLRCEHARFVAAQNVQIPPAPPVRPVEGDELLFW